MSSIVLPNNHTFLTTSGKVSTICKPLFLNYDISFFDYGRVYHSGHFFGLTTKSDSFRIFFDGMYRLLNYCEDINFINKKLYYYYVPNQSKDFNYNKSVFKVLNSDHGFQIIRKCDYYVDIFYFCSSLITGYKAINYYLNNLDIFYKFIDYFKKEAFPLLKLSYENRIVLPTELRPLIFSNDKKFGTCKSDNFTKKYKSTFKYINSISLTKRETDCLRYLCTGYTTKETAKILNLSPRTVESYLNNVKDKFGSKTNHDILKIISKTHLFYLDI